MTRTLKAIIISVVIVLLIVVAWLLWYGGLFGYSTGTEFNP